MPDQFEQHPERMPWNQPDDQDSTHRKIPPTAAAGQSRPAWPQSGPVQSGMSGWPQTEPGQSRPDWPQSGPGWPSTPLTPPVDMPPPPPSGGTFSTFASGTALPPPPPPPNPYDVPPTPSIQYPVHTATPMSQPAPAYAPAYIPIQTVKKPIYFPLTRKYSLLSQIISMLIYIVITVLSLMGCLLYMQNSYHPGPNASIYVNPDGSTNVLTIILTVALVLLVLPTCSLLSGALFGSWRGFLLSLLSLAGGILLTYRFNHQFIPGNPARLTETYNLQGYLLFACLPISALVVGLIYDRRKYAGWGKSFSTILLGSTIQVVWLVVTALIISVQTSSFLGSSSPSSSSAAFAALGTGLGCLALLAIPFLTFPIAIIEGIIHGRIAAVKRA